MQMATSSHLKLSLSLLATAAASWRCCASSRIGLLRSSNASRDCLWMGGGGRRCWIAAGQAAE